MINFNINLADKNIPVEITKGAAIFSIIFFILFLPAGFLTALKYSIFASVAIFASVFVHEVGHAFTAIKLGLIVRKVELNIFGGVAYIDTKSNRTAFNSAIVSVAGPVANLMIAVISWAVSFFFMKELFVMLAMLNLVLFGGNLLPISPMDGSKLVHAAVSYVSEENRALKAVFNLGTITTALMLIATVVLHSPSLSLIVAVLFLVHVTSCSELSFPRYSGGS
jgi:stage IV sporulation protein FB